MAELFADIPEALSNTIVIAEMCNFGFENTEHVLPNFETPKELSIDEYLEQKANEGLQKIIQTKHVPEENSVSVKVKRQQKY